MKRFWFALTLIAAQETRSVALRAQEPVVAGTVVDASSRQPLDAAEVTGGGVRAMTDAAGRFVLRGVSGSSIALQAHRIGYRPVSDTVEVGDKDVQLALTGAAVALDAIVVTGTGGATQARAVGNDIAKIDVGKSVIAVAPIADVQQMLSARTPGVMVTPYQGNVGTGGSIRVRGTSSLVLTNEPLVYVDGIRTDNNQKAGPVIRNGPQVSRINDLDPEDIESVEIVKGPAAATLYGTEASRGVIQIFTHRGVIGPPRFALSTRQGANWFMNPAGRLPWLYGQSLDSVASKLDSINLYLQEEAAGRHMFRTGRNGAYDGSVSGGTESVRYYLSGSAGRDEGIVSYNWKNAFGARANINILPNPKFEIAANVGLMQNEARLAQAKEGYGLMDQVIWGFPSQETSAGNLRGFFRATPEAVATIDSRSRIQRAIGSVRFQHQPWHWLTQRLTLGVDAGDEASTVLFPRWADPQATCPFADSCLGEKSLTRRQVTYSTVDYSLNLASHPSGSLSATTALGAQYYAKRIALVTAQGKGFPSPDVTAISAAAVTTGGEDLIVNKSVGVFMQQGLGWRNRIFLTGALRADDNSTFGENFNVILYPKVSASWVVNEERFWPLHFISTLKLRGAWGQAGQQPDVYASLRAYSPTTGPGDLGTLTPKSVGNPDIKPERGQELEAGLDGGLFQDRVSVGFTYFAQRTRDVIVPLISPPSTGFPGPQPFNLGAISNRGTETSVDARLLQGRALGWSLGLTFSTNHSLVESLGGAPSITLASIGAGTGNQFFLEGYPIAAWFARRVVSADRDANGRPVNILCDGGPQKAPVACSNNATTNPLVYLGPPNPTWEGALRTTITVSRNLRLYGLVDFRGGNIVNNGDLAFGSINTPRNSRAINDSSDVLLLAIDSLTRAGVTNILGQGIMKGGFAKLREVSVAYSFPHSWAARFGAEGTSVTIAARNLAILWREQRAVFGQIPVDPETRWPDELSSFARNSMPQSAQLLVTVRVTF